MNNHYVTNNALHFALSSINQQIKIIAKLSDITATRCNSQTEMLQYQSAPLRKVINPCEQ